MNTGEAVADQEGMQDAELSAEEQAQAEADFEAAFNTARGVEPHAEGTTSTEEATAQEADAATSQDNAAPADEGTAAQDDTTAEAQAQADAQAAAEAESAKKLIAGMTEDELKAVLDKARQVDKAFGKIGTLEQTVQELKKAAASPKQSPKLSADRLKRLSAEFPDLAKILIEDLNDIEPDSASIDAPAGNPAPAANVDDLVAERVSHVERQMEIKLLTIKHPDWREVRTTPEFTTWKAGLKPEALELLETTSDAVTLAQAFDAYKDWDKQRKAATAEAAAKASQAVSTAKKSTDKRLERTVAITGSAASGAPVLDDTAAFEAGFKAARGGR